MRVQVERRHHGSIIVASLAGELDHHAAQAVRTALDQELTGRRRVRLILDLSEVTFMDSSGLGVILGRYKKVQDSGGEMVIAGVSKAIDRLLEMSGLHKIVRMYPNCETAVVALKEVAK